MTEDDRRIRGMVSIAVPSERVTRTQFGRHGFAGGALLVDWAAIVGGAVASHTLPLRIKFPPRERADGTLVVKVDSGAFATQLQHLEPLVIERINGYFGWKAVTRLQMKQGPLPLPDRPRLPPEPPAASAALKQTLAAVDDPELRAVLERLGRRIAARP